MFSEKEKIFLKTILNILYECKYSKKEWNDESVNKVYKWIELFENQFLKPLSEYIKVSNNNNNNNNNNNSFNNTKEIEKQYIIKLWDELNESISNENKFPKLNIEFTKLIDNSINLKDYIFNLWVNNLYITENKFSFFLNYHFNNINSNNDNDGYLINLNRNFNQLLTNNSFNSLLIEYNKNQLNQLNNNINLSISISTKENDNNNNFKISLLYNIESLLYKNDNLKKKASAQLILKYLIKKQKEEKEESLNKEILEYMDKLFSEEESFNIYLWLILIIIEKEIIKQHFPNQYINNNTISKEDNIIIFNIYSTLIKSIDNNKNPKKIKFFLKADKELLLEISKNDKDFYKVYSFCVWRIIDYYLFSNQKITIDPNYLSSISDSLKSLNQIDNTIQININQRLLGTNILKTNEYCKSEIIEMLINFKNLNSKII